MSMNTHLLNLVGAAVLVLAALPTFAQQRTAVAPPSPSALVGRWLHNSQGRVIGSVKLVSPDGQTATIVLGVYKFDNVRVVRVPVKTLSVVNGKATLRSETAEALRR